MRHTALLALVAACAARAPDPAPGPTFGPTSPPPVRGDQVVLTGVVRYTPLPPTMSVEAYLSEDITLVGESGTWDLSGSASVPDDAIAAFAGQRVEVVALPIPERLPDPREASPSGPDGPMPRPPTWEVLAIRPLP